MSEVTRRWTEFRQLSRALRAVEGETARLQMVVDAAPVLVPTCAHAGMTLNEKGGVVTRVSRDDVVSRANELQFELGEGPCLDMGRDQDTVVIPDLACDHRWRRWSTSVQEELGVNSMMSLLVYTDQQSYGALSSWTQALSGGRRDRPHAPVATSFLRQVSGPLVGSRFIYRDLD